MDSLLRANLASGAIDGVVGMYDDGREERTPKGK
jgi:hypothetical protein